MAPKRKTDGGGGRVKRPKQSSADVENSEERMQTRQKTDDKDAPPMLSMTEQGSSKLHKTLPIGEADANGEADGGRVDATHDKDARGEKEELGKANTEEQQQQGAIDEPGNEGDGDQLSDHGADIAKSAPPTSTRGRGRGRPKRARGAASGLTRSSLRKVPQETQAQLTSEPPNTWGRTAARGRGRGMVAFSPPRIESPPTEGTTAGAGAKEGAVTEGKERKDEEDEKIEGEGEAGAVSHQSLPQPPPLGQSQEVRQIEHSPQELSHQIHGVGQSGHAPAGPFPPHHPAYYPSYPPQAGSLPYSYGAPPSPAEVSSAPDGRPYPALRSDEAQSMYTTSFATTVRTGNEPNSASSSFNTPYPPSALPAHPLDAIAPQGNPFPPTAPTMPVSAYGPAVYKVIVSDDDDDRDQSENSGSSVHVPSPKKQAASAAKGGGRPGHRGHHLACHFCRGRKLKCDGRRPTCGHCALRNQACVFDASLRRRGLGRKEKKNQRDRNVMSSKWTEGAIPDLSASPQTSTQSHSQMSTSTEGVKGKRHHPHHTNGQSQTSGLGIEEADGTGIAGPAMKPATAAYGIENNERLGFYYVGGGPGQFCAPYPSYGDYNQAASAHPPPQQAAYAYAQGGGEDDADGEGEAYGSRPGEGGSYGQPPNVNYSHSWPTPGGVPVSHRQHM